MRTLTLAFVLTILATLGTVGANPVEPLASCTPGTVCSTQFSGTWGSMTHSGTFWAQCPASGPFNGEICGTGVTVTATVASTIGYTSVRSRWFAANDNICQTTSITLGSPTSCSGTSTRSLTLSGSDSSAWSGISVTSDWSNNIFLGGSGPRTSFCVRHDPGVVHVNLC